MGLQEIVRLVYPPQCLTCDAPVTTDFGLCGTCWRDTPFLGGLVCDLCGAPLIGDDHGQHELCDDCLTIARPWARGRAAMLYDGNARKLVLALKHGDRLDLARPMAAWLRQAAQPLLQPGMLVAPVPLHWTRLLTRHYNQAAVLSGHLARMAGLDHCPDLLTRPRRTGTQDGKGRDARFANMDGAIRLHPKRRAMVRGRSVLLVDDVMTSGATLAASTDACLAGGATEVSVLVMARVAKAP